MPSQCAGTGKEALDCVLKGESFGCHHGMKEGQPTKLCVGWVAALAAPFAVVQNELRELHKSLCDLPDDDPVRAEFDEWSARLDPNGKFDVYQLGRAYAARSA